MHKEIGKIKGASFGYGGYQDVMVVFRFNLGGKGWGVIKEFIGGWGHVSKEDLEKPDSTYEWTHEKRIKELGEAAWDVFKLIQDAGVNSLDELVGLPIEATFEHPAGKILSFRILKEVL